jgi:hypothetical protein
MKKTIKKLSLRHETVRALDENRLRGPAGGLPWTGGICYTATSYNCTAGHSNCDLKTSECW